MGNDAQRARLYNAAKESWGEEVADDMMDVLPPWDHAEVVRKVDLENVHVALQSQIDGLRTETTIGMSSFRTAVDARFDQVDAKFERLEARIDAQFVRLVALFLPLMLGLAAVLVAAVSLG